jgi:hypothetical protein
MEREEFKAVLRDKGYPYREEGGRLVIDYLYDGQTLDLSDVKTIPSEVSFRNINSVYLDSLEAIPSGVEFSVKYVRLYSLKRISPSSWFSLDTTVFSNAVWQGTWGIRSRITKFGIPGINHNRVLNRMISLGLFDRKEIR